jgi:hypothetical protein
MGTVRSPEILVGLYQLTVPLKTECHILIFKRVWNPMKSEEFRHTLPKLPTRFHYKIWW